MTFAADSTHDASTGPLRVGIGGPVGSGKTTLTEKLCRALRQQFSIAVITMILSSACYVSPPRFR